MTGIEMPVIWTSGGAALVTGGTSTGNWSATGVSIDSRTLQPGDLFVALAGPNFDAHDYAAAAASRGAVAIVARHDQGAKVTDLPNTTPVLFVDDTMSALEDLARAARSRTEAKIIAVTGSVGKTGTKEALRLALADQGRVSATLGNLNNHWGLPLSLARLPAMADFGIFEMGMSHPGEIAPLSAMARPQVSIITEIADVHAEFFTSLEDIADAKAEIFVGMDDDGTAVINRDNPLFERLNSRALERGVGRILTFGAHPEADVCLKQCELYGDASDVVADVAGHVLRYRIGIAGRHVAINTLAVLAAVHAVGADLERAAAQLAFLHALKGRGERHTIALADGQFVLIDESYNASPVSMQAAISVLANSDTHGAGRRIAVLGDMLELGDNSESLHAGLATNLTEENVDLVFTAGQHMSALWEALPADLRGGHANLAAKLAPMVTAAVGDGDVVMVKGSFGSRMGQIVEQLQAIHFDQDARTDIRAPKAVNGE